MLIQTNKPKQVKFDEKAGKQIFLGTADDKWQQEILNVSAEDSNPIDTRLRQLALTPDSKVNLKDEFYGKWALVLTYRPLTFHTGRIERIFTSRDVQIKTRRKQIVIVPFVQCQQIYEKEIN